MACEVCGMSCSLCPWCGTNSCPRSNEKSERYWIYAKDRLGSYLMPIFKTDDRKKLLEKLIAIKEGRFHKTWAKKYITSTILGEKVGDCYPNAKRVETKYVQLTITDGEINWYTDIELVLDIEEHKLYTYKQCNLTYDTKLEGIKEWNEKLKFSKHK